MNKSRKEIPHFLPQSTQNSVEKKINNLHLKSYQIHCQHTVVSTAQKIQKNQLS